MWEQERGRLINDLQNNVDYSFGNWNPDMKIWRSGEIHEKRLPFGVVDFLPTSRFKFKSLGDAIGKVDDIHYQYGYCELEMVTISIYANKFQNNRKVNAREFAYNTLLRIRKHIFRTWPSILRKFGASIERGINANIIDLTDYREDIGTRMYEYDMNFYLRTDVRWDNRSDWIPPDGGEDLPGSEIPADKAIITKLNEQTNIRVEFNG